MHFPNRKKHFSSHGMAPFQSQMKNQYSNGHYYLAVMTLFTQHFAWKLYKYRNGSVIVLIILILCINDRKKIACDLS